MNPENNAKRRYFDKEASVYRDFKYRQKYMEDQCNQMNDIFKDMKTDMQDMKATLAIIAGKLNINVDPKKPRKNKLSSAVNVKKETTSRCANTISEKPIIFLKSYSDNSTLERRTSSLCSNLPIRAPRGSKLRLIPRSMVLKEDSKHSLILPSTEEFQVDEKLQVNENITSSKLSNTCGEPAFDEIYQDTTDDLVTTENPLHKGLQESDAVFDVSSELASDAESKSSFSCLDILDISSPSVAPHVFLPSALTHSSIFTFDASTPITHTAGVLISVMEFLLFLFSAIWFEVLLWWIEGFV